MRGLAHLHWADLGYLAVTANNPLTLLLVWGALDITELIIQLRSVDGPSNNEKVVISFSTRALGIGLLLWANIVSIAQGSAFNFESIAPSSGLYLVAAAGLRLGVLPLHLPYSSESTLRRGLGTSLRLISAASSIGFAGACSCWKFKLCAHSIFTCTCNHCRALWRLDVAACTR